MPTYQLEIIYQFCMMVGGLIVISAVAMKVARVVTRPSGTYGAGLPERRSRPRYVVPNPPPVDGRDVVSNVA